VACTHCGNTDTLLCSVFSRYFSLFWIPVFPIGKTSVTVCQHCKQTLTSRELPASYQVPVQAIQGRARTPLSSFALLLIAGTLVVLFAGLVAYTKFFGPLVPATTTTTAPARDAALSDSISSAR